jgi:hypothetical protein
MASPTQAPALSAVMVACTAESVATEDADEETAHRPDSGPAETDGDR